MPIDINLDNVEPWKGLALPPGLHQVRCAEAEEGTSAGGHFELHFTWEATGGEHQGGTVQDWVQVTDATLGKVRQVLDACGVQVPGGQFKLGASLFDGRVCDVVVRERPKPDGTPRLEVMGYQRPRSRSDVPGAGPGEFQHPQNAGSQYGERAPF